MKRKAHFEEVFANAGLLLLLGALVSGALGRGIAPGPCGSSPSSPWREPSCGSPFDSAVRSTSSRPSPRPTSASSGSCSRRFIMARTPSPSFSPRSWASAALALVFAAHRRMQRAMRPDSAAWERAAEVRAAAEGWRQRRRHRRGDARRDRHQAFPDPCVRPSMRLASADGRDGDRHHSLHALARSGSRSAPRRAGSSSCCSCSPEPAWSRPSGWTPRRDLARRGAAGATSFWGVVLFLAALGLFLIDTMKLRLDDALDAVLAAGILAWGVSAWRWGNWLFAGLSAVSLFVFLGRLPQGRVLCIAGRRRARPVWPPADWTPPRGRPSHRRAAAVLVVLGIVAAYAATNVYSLDAHLLEHLRRIAVDALRLVARLFALSAVGTAALPAADPARGASAHGGRSSSTRGSSCSACRSSPCGTTSISRRSGSS